MVGVADSRAGALIPGGDGTTHTDVEEVRYICHGTALRLSVVDSLPDTVCVYEFMHKEVYM